MAIEFQEVTKIDDDFPASKMLEGYDQPAVIEEPTPVDDINVKVDPEKQEPTATDITDAEGRVPESVWRANPDKYFQRGAKKGLPRDKPATPMAKTSVSFNKEATTTIPGGVLINGAIFITFINFIIPYTIVTVNRWLTKEKMNVKDLKLTGEERRDIDPLMDATLKQLNIMGNPLVLLGICLVATYSMKFANAKLGMNEEPKEEKK